MTVTPEPLPIESTHCRVRARISNIYADSVDEGTGPDWRAPRGEAVTLVPGVAGELLAYDAQGPEPRVVMVEKVDCVVGEGGWLKTKADGQDVYIVPTDDPLLSVTGWTWTATIRGKSVVFAAPMGGVVDLAMFVAAPATDDTKAWVERIPELVALIEAGSDPAAIGAAVEDYLADNPPAAAPDATTAAKGLVRLAGDLGGTADAPTVPGLADKADAEHGHDIGDVSGLQAALDGKQPSGSYAAATHQHTMADLTDYTPPDPGGMKVYTSWAEVDAETESTMGVLTTDDWAPAGLTHDGTHDAAFFITTHVQTIAAGDDAEVWRHQYLRMWDGVGYAPIWMSRDFSYGGPWSSWGDVTYWELPPALRGSLAKAEDAVVQLYNADFDNPKASYVVGQLNANWRTLTGFAELPDTSAVALVSRGGSLGRSGNWAQTVVVPVAGGTRTITRVSTDGTSYGAWTLQPSIPDDTGTRDITALLSNGDAHYLDWGPVCHIRRIGSVVYFSVSIFLKMPDPATVLQVHPGGAPGSSVIPAGFRPSTWLNLYGLYHYVEMNSGGRFEVSRFPAHDALRQPWRDGEELICSGSWTTLDPWPTILPGTPA